MNTSFAPFSPAGLAAFVGQSRAVRMFLLISMGLLAVGLVGGVVLIERVKHQLYLLQAEAEQRQTEAMVRLLARDIRQGRPEDEVLSRLQAAIGGGAAAQGTFICLLDKNGVLLSHPNPSMIGVSKAGMSMQPLREGADSTYGGLISQGRAVAALQVDARSTPEEIVYMEPVPGTTWTLASHENARGIEERFRRLAWQLAAIAAPTIGLMALVGTSLARAVGRRYERRIEEANAQLERRVAERTAELQGALGELREAHERLVQGEKMHLLGELMAGIAHEIANPLCVVTGYASVLAGGNYDPAVRRFGAGIEAGAERARKIVANLLDFARRKPPTRRRESMVELLNRAIELIAADLRRANVTLETSFPDRSEPLRLDPQQMEQVFLNLLNNARQALANHEGERRVRLIVRDNETGDMEVTVADTGPGLAPQVRAQLFRPFLTTKESGTGLGLSLCRRFVEAHGGRIEAPECERGTCFVVTLPREAVGSGEIDGTPVAAAGASA